jgi:hypothetical protein
MSMRAQSRARMGAAGDRRHPTRAPEDGWTPCHAMRSARDGSWCRCVPFAVGKGPYRLWGTAVFSHASLSVNLLGGTLPHIGAVAVAIPRPESGPTGAAQCDDVGLGLGGP